MYCIPSFSSQKWIPNLSSWQYRVVTFMSAWKVLISISRSICTYLHFPVNLHIHYAEDLIMCASNSTWLFLLWQITKTHWLVKKNFLLTSHYPEKNLFVILSQCQSIYLNLAVWYYLWVGIQQCYPPFCCALGKIAHRYFQPASVGEVDHLELVHTFKTLSEAQRTQAMVQ